MKLLMDEHLSGRFVGSLADLYPGSDQVLLLGLGGAEDGAVWEHAKLHGFMIMSTDSDFRDRSILLGAPPKVIWIRLGNCSTSAVESVLRSRYESICRFWEKDSENFLVLGRA